MKRTPFIPAWIDDLGLTKSEFRVLMHLWRRGKGTCYPSVDRIAEVCRMHADTVAKALNALEKLGLISRRKRKGRGVHNHNEYELLIPNDGSAGGADLSDESENPLDFMDMNAPRIPDDKRRKTRGGKVPHGKVTPDEGYSGVTSRRETSPRDSNSEPIGSASYYTHVPLPNEEDTAEHAEEYHERNRFNPDSQVGVLSESEIRQFALKWLTEAQATGGYYKGSVIRMPYKALEAYLISCADNQSKRCKEFHVSD